MSDYGDCDYDEYDEHNDHEMYEDHYIEEEKKTND